MSRLSWTKRLNHKLILNIFIALVGVVTLVLVSYTVFITSLRFKRISQRNYVIHNGKILVSENSNLEYKNNLLDQIPKFSNQSLRILDYLPQKKFRAYKETKKPLVLSRREHCKESYCSEYLSHEDYAKLKNCSYLANVSQADPVEAQERECHFINQTDSQRDPVALVSFPGSGNTWIRGLLEATTGICTGAVYCDISLRKSGFVGEFIQSGAALVIKTHDSTPSIHYTTAASKILTENNSNRKYFGSAILIVRNPFDALVSEWNRMVANGFNVRTIVMDSHTKAAGEKWFGTNKKWNEFVKKQMTRWRAIIKNWFILNHRISILVVKYESMKTDTLHEVERIFKFLNVKYDRDTLEQKLKDGFHAFHRKHYPQGFIHYTDKQIHHIIKVILDVQNLLIVHRKTHLFTVDEYLKLEKMNALFNGTKWYL